MNESNYILNVDWLTIRGTHNLDIAKRNFAGKEWRDMVDEWEKTRAEKSARDQMKDQAEMFTGVIQHTIGNCILDVQPYGTRQYLVLFHAVQEQNTGIISRCYLLRKIHKFDHNM